VLHGDGDRLLAVALSPDRRTVALGDNDGTVTLVDARSRKARATYQIEDGNIRALTFSPDGSTVAVDGFDPAAEDPDPVVDLIDARTAARTARIEPGAFPGEPGLPYFARTLFLGGSRDLLVGLLPDVPDAPPAVLQRFDGRTGSPRGRVLRLPGDLPGLLGTAGPATAFVTTEARTYAVDTRPMIIVGRHHAGDFSTAVSADGRTLALGSRTGGVRLVDVRSGRARRLSGRHDAAVQRVAFTPDGRTLVSSGDDGSVITWDVDAGEIRETLRGHSGRVLDIAISRDGGTLYTAALDGSAIGWHLVGDRRLGRPFAAGRPFEADDGYPPALALSPADGTLALGQSDGTVNRIDPVSLRQRQPLPPTGDGFAAAVAFSPDGRLLAVTGEGGRVRLADATTGDPAGPPLEGLEATSQTVAISPDGRLVAAADLAGQVRVWDVRTGRPTPLRFEEQSLRLAFSPDSRLLAIAAGEAGTVVRDTSDGRLVARLPTGDWMRAVAFSPDGRLLATGTFDGLTELWSTDGFRRVGAPLAGHEGFVLSVQFSPRGTMLATGSTDGTVILWDVATRKPIGSALTVDPNRWVTAVFSRDGARLFAVSDQGRGMRWDVAPADWSRHACATAGRELTAREWRDAVREQPPRPVCPVP
jgi:WD40 repeat protein